MSLPTPRGVSLSTSAALLCAVASISAAAWLSLQPHRLADFTHLTTWVQQWRQGVDLYRVLPDVDYPPWAIVTLSPLAWVQADLVAPLWVLVNVLALGFVAVTLANELGTRGRTAMPLLELTALLVAAGAMRTLNQFSLVAMALALAGQSGRGPMAPFWLGLSLMKPQVGGVFWLGAVWRGQWRLALGALIVPLVLTILYATHVGVTPVSGIAGWTSTLVRQRQDFFPGQTEILAFTGGASAFSGLLASGVVAVCVFFPLRRRADLGLALASLLSVRHLSYDLILLLPTMAGLGRAGAWAAMFCLGLDPSAVAQVLAPGSWIAAHGDRVALFLGWIAISAAEIGLARRQGMTK